MNVHFWASAGVTVFGAVILALGTLASCAGALSGPDGWTAGVCMMWLTTPALIMLFLGLMGMRDSVRSQA